MRHFFRSCCLVLALCGVMTAAMAQKKPVTKGACLISELKNIGLYTHEVAGRIQLTRDWLAANARYCSESQLRMINSNRGSWLGHADTLEISLLLDKLYEAKISNDPELMARVFESAGKERYPVLEVSRNPPRPAPVVSPIPTVVIPPGVGAYPTPPANPPKSPLQTPLPGGNDLPSPGAGLPGPALN